MTLEGGKNTGAKFVVKGGAVKGARDVIINHNSAGTLNINTFYVENQEDYIYLVLIVAVVIKVDVM